MKNRTQNTEHRTQTWKERLVSAVFGNAIKKEVQKRLPAASLTDRKEDEGWRKLTASPTRDLLPIKQDRMIEIAFYLWENNPLAFWIIEIIKDFIVAEGLPYTAKNDKIKSVIDDFWYDPLNKMDIYLEKHVRELFLYGELCLPVFVAEQTGRVRLGYIDPAQIEKVETDPENVKVVIGIILKSEAGGKKRMLRTILPKDAEYVLSHEAKNLRDSYVDGPCFFFAVNNVTNSPRGRSELLVIADWLDAYEQFLFDYADKWPLLATFVWDLLVEGGTPETIQEQIKAFTKKSGSVYGHNEKVKLEASTPDLKAPDVKEGARLFRNHILGAKSIPEHWYGGKEGGSYELAVDMGTPTYKSLSSKQRYFKFILESIFEFVIETARAAYYLKVSDEDAGAFTVNTPELSSKDVSKYAAVIQQVTTSLVAAEMQGWVDKETARNIFAAAINYLGVEIDTKQMEEKIEEGKDKKGYEDYLKNPDTSGRQAGMTNNTGNGDKRQ